MKQFIGTKIVLATPLSRGEYNLYRGWTPPEGEDQAVDGYLVEYQDGGQPNDSRHGGYISWSPKGVFDAAYVATGYDLALNLPPHQQRVLAEKAELDDRRGKLQSFIKDSPVFCELPGAEKERLLRQEECMTEYSHVLRERIAAFCPSAPVKKEEGAAEPTRDIDGDGICTRCGAMFEEEVEAEDHLNGPMCEEAPLSDGMS